MVVLRTASEIAVMREAGRAVAQAARPGVRLSELDRLAAETIAAAGAKPSFLGYRPRWAPAPYPAVVCLSVNDAIVHGIPGDQVLADGDVLSVDCGAHIDGYHGDAAITVAIGQADPGAQRLIDTAWRALEAGISAARPGGRLGDIGHAIQTVARAAGYGQPEGLGGHGIGQAMHEDPDVPNTGRPGRGLPLREGLVIAIEPMLTENRDGACRTAPDGWTVVTADGSRAAHTEHTVAVTDSGPVVLTAL